MPWLTPNVFKQAADEALVRLPRYSDGPKRVRFRHIIHAYRDQQLPQNTAVQGITFETVLQAAKHAAPEFPVTCVAVTYPEDRDLVPSGIAAARPLSRVVGDVATFKVSRVLPLLFDVLKLGAEVEWTARREPNWLKLWHSKSTSESRPTDETEYVVMTNSDIHVQPAFYRVLATLIAQGYDVITVNRRTLDVDLNDRDFSPLFMADHGKDHGGFDCFVFPQSMMDSFVESTSCCGAGHVMRSLLFNLVAHANRFLMLTQAHLTYHLGDDQVWNTEPLKDYIDYNIAQGRAVIASLSQDPAKAQRLAEFVAAHEPAVYAGAWLAKS